MKFLSAVALPVLASLFGCSTSADMLEGHSGRHSRGNGSASSTQTDEIVLLTGEPGSAMGGSSSSAPAGADSQTDSHPDYPSKGDVDVDPAAIRLDSRPLP